MSAAKHSITNHGAVLAVDATPNASAPPAERIWSLTRPPTGAGTGVWYASEGGAPTFALWAKLTNQWFFVTTGGGGTFTGVLNSFLAIAPGIIPPGADLFAQVTAAGGCTALHFGTTTE